METDHDETDGLRLMMSSRKIHSFSRTTEIQIHPFEKSQSMISLYFVDNMQKILYIARITQSFILRISDCFSVVVCRPRRPSSAIRRSADPICKRVKIKHKNTNSMCELFRSPIAFIFFVKIEWVVSKKRRIRFDARVS